VPTTHTPTSDAARINLILSKVDSIPPLSNVAARLLNMTSARDADMGQVVKIIESDPAFSTTLLGLCRRSDKALGDRVTTVRRAILMLGFDTVKSAALSLSVYKLISERDEPARRALDSRLADDSPDDSGAIIHQGPPAFDRPAFWKHSIAVACASELIADMHPRLKVLGAEAFLGGLLHGVGKLVMESVLPHAYDSVLRLAAQRCCNSATVEREMLGLDYLLVGHRAAEHWGLPPAVAAAALLHNAEPQTRSEGSGEHTAMVAIVSAAKVICRWLHLGWSGDFGPPARPERVWIDAKLDRTIVERTGLGAGRGFYERLYSAAADRFAVLDLTPQTAAGVMLESIERANACLTHVSARIEYSGVEKARAANKSAA